MKYSKIQSKKATLLLWATLLLLLKWLPSHTEAANSKPNATKKVSASTKWETLKNCTLATNEGNDGDSFHISYQGKDMIIRLYMVDCPETKYEYIERILKQMQYFEASHNLVIQIGELSKEYTKSFLKKPFTVTTKWEDALGSGKEPRFYGFVQGPNNKDLGEALIELGLGRSFGKEPSGAKINPKIREKYESSQKIAKKNQLGIWSISKTPKIPGAVSKYVNSNTRKEAISRGNATTKREGLPTQLLIDSLKKTRKSTRPEVKREPNSIFFNNTNPKNPKPYTITKEELDILMPKAKEIDYKANKKNK